MKIRRMMFVFISSVLAVGLGCVEDLLGPGNYPPDAPLCVKPEDGATNVSVNTILEWSCSDPDGDELTYEVYICPEGGDWTRIDDEYIDGTRCNLPFTLEYETWYYWYVVAADPEGLTSEPDGDWTFQTEPETGTPPDAPSLVYPEDGETDVDLRPTFLWSVTKSFGWAPFEQVPSRPTGGGISRNSSSPGTSTNTATAAYRSTRASAETVRAMGTQAPTHAVHDSGGIEPPSPADSYRIQVDDDSDFGSPLIDESSITDNDYRPTSDLDAETTYYWRVMAHNDWGDSDWSAVWSFTTRPPADEPPETPQLIYPDDGDTDVPLRPTFRWTATKNDGGLVIGLRRANGISFDRLSPAEDYHIQVDDEPSFSSPRVIDVEYVPTNEYTHDGDLAYGTGYYWRVRARNDAGYSDWSEANGFTTEGHEWHIETVDRGGYPGCYSSLELDSSGYPHISYWDRTNDNLKYAYWTGSSWHIETVDATTDRVGQFTSLELDSNSYPHIAYHDFTNWKVKYASWNGSSWQIESVGSGSGYLSLALDSSDRPHISYWYQDTDDLRYASWTGSSWQIETVDVNGGRNTSLALDSSNYPCISYYDRVSTELKFARWNGGSWQIQTVETTGADGVIDSLALDSSGDPCIAYCYVSGPYNYLKYARWDGGAWQKETVSNTCHECSLALDSSDRPCISFDDYYDDMNLIYARWDGDEWLIEVVDSEGIVGRGNSLALDSSDNPHISYSCDTTGDLNYAYWE